MENNEISNKEDLHSYFNHELEKNENEREEAGSFPYTRGIHADMYKSKPWTIRQYSGYGTPKETNERFRKLISQGTSGLSLAFDLPTQLGLDPDNPQASGEVGRVGVTVSTLDDMREIFKDIDMKLISTSMTINATAPILLLMYEIIALEKGLAPEEIKGTIQNDILKEFIARGTYIFPGPNSMRLSCDTLEYVSKNLPKLNAISISGYHMAEAGATAVQELAFTFSNAIEYLDEMIKRGYKVDEISKNISFFFVSSINIIETVSKFRAARKIWAEMLREKYGVLDDYSLKLKFHTQTAGVELIAQDPEVNLTRTALQTLGAVLGGAQSIHTNAYDEALGLPTENAVKLAVRTQQVILYESGLTNTPDPLGGSYLVEEETKRILDETKSLMREVVKLGGSLVAIEKNFQSKEIAKSALVFAENVENRITKIVGLNILESKEDFQYSPLEVDENVEASAREKLTIHKTKRDNKVVEIKLETISNKALGIENLLIYIKEAILSGATVGEITNSLKRAWGLYIPVEDNI